MEFYQKDIVNDLTANREGELPLKISLQDFGN